MTTHALRGSRIGAGPMGEPARGDLAARTTHSFWCSEGHETLVAFADEVATPPDWDCSRCSRRAGRDRTAPPERAGAYVYKSHLQYVQERRTPVEAEALLAEALAARRNLRG